MGGCRTAARVKEAQGFLAKPFGVASGGRSVGSTKGERGGSCRAVALLPIREARQATVKQAWERLLSQGVSVITWSGPERRHGAGQARETCI